MAAKKTTARRRSGPERRDGVLVVGGGYAGLHAASAVSSAALDVAVINPTPEHDFVTRLAAVAGGASPVSDASRPLERFVDDVIVGRVTGVGDGTVELDDGRRFAAEAVIVTAGASPTRPPIDGIEHALTLRTSSDALALRAAIEEATALVVIGGGATGVQLAGAASHAHRDLEIDLIEASPRLLSALDSRLGDGAVRILNDRGVRVHLDRSVQRITSDGAVIGTDGGSERLLEGVVVWAGGFGADAAAFGLPDVDGRIAVESDLRVMGSERTFAAGDVAAHLDADGDLMAMSAQIAVQAGTTAGENAVRVIAGDETEPADLVQRGWVLDLSGNRGLAEFGPIPLAAPFLDLLPPFLHDGIDLKNLVEIGGVEAAVRHAPRSVRTFFWGVPFLR